MVPLACYFNTVLLSEETVQFSWKLDFPLIIVLIVLLMFSAFFSSCETAFSSVSMVRLKSMADEKRPGARKALYLAERYDALLTTILVGNNLVNIGATTIAAYIFGKLITDATLSNLLNTVIMTVLVLIFGEITPKSYAKQSAEKVILKFSGILYVIQKILWPLSFIFHKIRCALVKKSETSSPQVTEEELETIIETMEDEGVIENDGAELMQNALNINDKTVYEIMTPRVDVVAINVDEPIEDIKKIFFEYQYSRMPVYDRDKDNIIGILRERDFFTSYINTGGKNVNVRSLMDSPYFVSKATKVDDLIKDMQNFKKHFAVVCDEYGGTSGIVTLEDALEELVGEIYDESDEVPEQSYQIKQLKENKYMINPEMDLEDLFDELDLGKAPESKYRNVGGFVYELSEEPPYKGKAVSYIITKEDNSDFDNPIIKEYELIFVIDRVVKRRIRTLILEIKDNSENKEE